MNTKGLALNSILIVISTSIIGTILHESAHYLVGILLNLNPELHHNYVRPLTKGTELQIVLMAGAGPLFSLVFGCLILYISINFIKPSLIKLFMTWLGMGSVLGLLGYLLIAPFAKDGDTGRIFSYLGVPTFISIVIAIASFIFISYLFRKWSSQFIFYKTEDHFDKKETQKQLFIYPIFASMVIMTFLSFPITAWVSLLPTIFMPMTYFSTYRKYKRMDNINPDLTINKVSSVLVVLTILTIIIFRYLV
jgi:hypothetical protein